MATSAQATYNQAGLSGAFDKAKFNAQYHAIHQGDFEALRPRAQTTPNMTLQVQAATVTSFYRQVYYNNAQSTYAGGNSPTFTAPVSNPRIDLLYLSDTGVLTITQGTEAVSPVPPAYPDLSKNVPICEVFLRVGMTTIVNFEDSGANPTQGYIYRDVRPRHTLGGVTAHSGLSGLTAGDDHTQYAKLAGRAGGQTVQGGAAASENLNLESTSHATKGAVVIKGGRAKFEDAAVDPGAAGEFFRNGVNYKFHDGTAVRTLVHSNTTAGGDLSGTYPNPTIAKTPAWVFVETITLSGASIVSATLPTTSNVFMLLFDEAASSAGALQLRPNSGTGADKTHITFDSISAFAKSTGQTVMVLCGTTAPIYGAVIFARLASGAGSGHPFIGPLSSAAADATILHMGSWINAAAITTIQLLSASGTLSGKVHVFRLSQA